MIQASYYGMYSYLDDKLGQLLDILEDMRIRDNTMVVFASDHGEMMGRKHMFEKRTFFEDSARVPLVVSMPSRFGAREIESEASLLDLFPTFAALAGSDWPADSLSGKSLVPALHGDESGLRHRGIVCEYYGESLKYPFRAIVRDRLKYVHFPEAPQNDLLFDLKRDPSEKCNVIAEAEHAAAARELLSLATNNYDYPRVRRLIHRSCADRRAIVDSYPFFQPDWNYYPPYPADRMYNRPTCKPATA